MQARETLGLQVPNLVFDIETLRAKQYYSNIESSVLRFFTTRLTQSSDRIAEERYITCQRKARTPDPLKRLGLTDIGSILWTVLTYRSLPRLLSIAFYDEAAQLLI